MTTRGPEHIVKPLTEKHTMSAADLAATALSPDAAMPLKVRPPARPSAAARAPRRGSCTRQLGAGAVPTERQRASARRRRSSRARRPPRGGGASARAPVLNVAHSHACRCPPPSASALPRSRPSCSTAQFALPPQRDEGPRAATATQAALRKRLLGRQNKIHYYTRAIQMEQLLGQVRVRVCARGREREASEASARSTSARSRHARAREGRGQLRATLRLALAARAHISIRASPALSMPPASPCSPRLRIPQPSPSLRPPLNHRCPPPSDRRARVCGARARAGP
jgi:hypothetical protein